MKLFGLKFFFHSLLEQWNRYEKHLIKRFISKENTSYIREFLGETKYEQTFDKKHVREAITNHPTHLTLTTSRWLPTRVGE